MGIIYLAALVIGVGTIAVQLLFAGKGDGAELDGADADGGDADGDADADGHVHGDAGLMPFLLSLRFWTFFLLAFGMVGTLLHVFQLASSWLTPILAVVMGAGSGALATWTFRALKRAETTSAASPRDTVGQVGKVLLPVNPGSRGKVRIELRGQSLDLIATTEDEGFASGELVMVEELDGQVVRVSRAPQEFLPPKLPPKS